MAKDNRVTRFAEERINAMEIQVRIYRDEAHKESVKANIKRAQAEALELEINNTKKSIEQGNYENGKDAQS